MTSSSEAPKGIASQHAADDNSQPFFAEEFDVNSAAVVSAAALEDAVLKAQKIIQIAKKIMERKMGGLQNRSGRLFKDGLRVKDRKVNSITHEGYRTKHINAKAQFVYKHDCNANERSITKETLIKQEIIVEKKEENETSHELGSIRYKLHADVTEKESAENVDKLSKHEEMENLISQEDGDHVKIGIESQQKIDYEMKYVFRVFKDADVEKKVPITRKQDLSKQQGNSQQEDMEKKKANYDVLRENRPRSICDDDIEEEIFEDACEWVQNEDETIDFLGSLSNDKKENATSDNITQTQGSCQPCIIDKSSEGEQVNDTSRIIDKATNNVHDFRVGEAEETKVASKLNKIGSPETATLVQGGAEDSEGGNHCDEEAVKSRPDMSNGKVQHVIIQKNFKAYSSPSVHGEHEKIIQVDEEMRETRNTQMTGKSLCKSVAGEGDETKSNEEMKTEKVVEINEDTPKVLFAMEGTETKKEKSRVVEEKEYLRKVYEERNRERQRDSDRIAVGRVIQEARDRAFSGAREKAERATVERAFAEVRQRSLVEACGKLEKATTAVKKSAEKALIEAKIRSERAAVERATAEARGRALEKALSQKNTSTTQVPQRPDDTCIKSAERSKARLERQNRIMERMAKALAEKNMRDLLAQKEEAEKNRLAKSLDAQIKRWSTGKEGNLRALLSTLHYILGPGSGWQPIPLTDIITSNAVKKAYRKAILYVHPDKLQQRGANIREKYICEKVFDLLKVGWAKFNSEER